VIKVCQSFLSDKAMHVVKILPPSSLFSYSHFIPQAGTGWASHSFVKLASTYDLRIVVVSPVNHFVFTPMLASAAVGTVEYRSMTEPIRVTNPFVSVKYIV
jgi:hypothetical protein